MKLKICLPIPDVTKSHLYEYDQLLRGYSKAILRVLHPHTKAGRKTLGQNKFQRAPLEDYDDIYGRYLYYSYDIKNKQQDKTVWLNASVGAN